MMRPKELTNTDPKLIQLSTHEYKNHEIENFLARAYALGSFVWTKTDPLDSILATYRFPDILLGQPALAAKARNFFGLRAGIEFMVLLNAQPFQAGNLLVTATPNAKYNPAKVAMYQESIPLRTGLPRVNLDLKGERQIHLKMPYDSPFVYFNLLFGIGTIADIDISVYSELQDVAADGVVKAEVYARFVDVDLEFPTGELPTQFTQVPALTESMEKFKMASNISTLNSVIDEAQQLSDRFKAGKFRFQANDADVHTTNMKLRALPNMAVTDTKHNAHVMSFYSNNVLKKTNMGKAQENEMRVMTALRTFNIHDRFDISPTLGTANVWSKQVSPKIPFKVNPNGALQVDYLYYHSIPFALWSGSIEYKFKIINTIFHSMRVRIFFSAASTGTNNIDRSSTYSKIIDIEKGVKEIFIQVPYMWPYPKLDVHKGNTSLGLVGFDIVNGIVAPDTVDKTVKVIVERRAGSDFQLDLPVPLTAFPFDPRPREEQVNKSRVVNAPPIRGVVSNAMKSLTNVPEMTNSTPEFVNRMDHLSTDLKTEILKNSFRFNKNYVSMLNDLAQYEQVGTNFLGLSSEQLKTRLQNIFTFKNPSKSFITHDELRKKRDLTQDGDVESNPGPTQVFSANGNPNISSTFVPTFTGPANVTISFSMYNLATTTWTLSGVISGDFRLCAPNTSSVADSFSFYVPSGSLSLTVITTSLQGTGACTVSVVYSNAIPTTIPNPLPVLITGQPLSVTSTNPTIIANPLPILITSQPIEIAGSVSVVEPLDVNVTNSIPIHAIIDNQPIEVDVNQPISTNIVNQPSVNIAGPLPLPTTGGGGTSSDIVTTTSYQFQMNVEEPTPDDTTFHRPEICKQVDLMTTGQIFESITTQISRASLFGTLDTTTKNQLVRLMPHALAVLQKDSDGLLHTEGCDLISYYAASFAFARGPIILQIVSAPDFAYTVYLDPDAQFFDIGSAPPVSQAANLLTPTERLRLRSALQQVIKPQIEGFGELYVPFYSNSYMYSVSPSTLYDPEKSNTVFTLPRTQLVLNPKGNFTDFEVYRTAGSDFEFSYLTGAPLLLPI